MLRRQQQIRTQVHQIADTCVFGVALWVAHRLRVATGDFALWPLLGGYADIEAFSEFIWLYFIILPFSPLLLDWSGFYRRPLIASRRQTAWPLFKACAVSVFGVILVMFFLKIILARSVIVLFGAVSFVMMMVKEELMRRWLLSKYGQEQLRHRVILVGTKEDTERLRRDLDSQAPHDLEIIAEVDINENPATALVELMHKRSATGVILSAAHTYFGQIEQAIEVCEREGVEVWLFADFFKTQVSRTVLDEFYGRPMLVFRSAPEASWQRVVKEVLDVIGSLLLLLILCTVIPIIPLAALLIKLTSPGPILFKQQRSGLHGRPFTMLKFRTMVSNAEQLKVELEALNEMSGPVFKVTNDPRVTALGRFLRRYSIDELPQLFNVVRGEMSLVGPRPLPVQEVERFDDPSDRRRLSVKPGLTCLWQVSGRNEVSSFKEWVRLDLEYIDRWSLWLDLKILLRTIPAVFSGTGAK
ncbi:MAG TPA: sugar transferase [Verrucomicrobiae bacterium]|jgi:exopolysaccharide biosynthesis polyprenyl glycosylphosphotransferase